MTTPLSGASPASVPQNVPPTKQGFFAAMLSHLNKLAIMENRNIERTCAKACLDRFKKKDIDPSCKARLGKEEFLRQCNADCVTMRAFMHTAYLLF